MQKHVSNFIDICVFIFLDNRVFSSSKLKVYSSSYTNFCIHLHGKINNHLNGCICVYIKSKCLCPLLLVDIYLINNTGDYAAITPEKRYLFLNFTSFGGSDENSFWCCVSITKYIHYLQCLNQQYFYFLL